MTRRVTGEETLHWRCCHEAGHAVAAIALGFSLEQVSVDDGGACRLPDSALCTRRDERNFAVVCAAGTVAQQCAGSPKVRETIDYGYIPESITHDYAEQLAHRWLRRHWSDVMRV